MGEAKLRRRLGVRFDIAPPENLLWPSWGNEFLKHVSCLEWKEEPADETARFFRHATSGMTVIVSGLVEEDGKRWLHVSCAHGDRLPSWDDLKLVKATFVGKDKKAVQIFSAEDEHINFNPYCLHLWHCLDGDGLPDFTKGRPKGVI